MILYCEQMDTDIDNYFMVSAKPFEGPKEYYFRRFEIHVYCWDDLCDGLAEYHELIQDYDFKNDVAKEFLKTS